MFSQFQKFFESFRNQSKLEETDDLSSYTFVRNLCFSDFRVDRALKGKKERRKVVERDTKKERRKEKGRGANTTSRKAKDLE